MHIEVRPINKIEMRAFYRIQQEYLDKESFETFRKKANTYSDMYLGAFKGKKLIGIVYGGIMKDNSPYLKGICVDLGKGYARKGIGSRLISTFERTIMNKGYKRVTVGSASDSKVEKFYIKNGWSPIEVVIKDRGIDLVRVKISNYKQGKAKRDMLKKKLNAKEGILIFEKKLAKNSVN